MNLEAVKQQKARLPENYQNAKTSLAACQKIDECKDWSDKAAALASYAKQADDDELERYAQRIRIRALRRCGELLKAIEKGKGGRPKTGGDASTSLTRKEAGQAAGLSKDQQMNAQRIASVDSESFELQVESDDPPTVTDLAEQGKKKIVFSKEEIDRVKANRKLQVILDRLDQFDSEVDWPDLEGLDANLADRAEYHSKMLMEVAACIRKMI